MEEPSSGQESKEIVGSFIKGVHKFLRRVLKHAPGFKIEISGGRIKLTHLFNRQAIDPR